MVHKGRLYVPLITLFLFYDRSTTEFNVVSRVFTLSSSLNKMTSSTCLKIVAERMSLLGSIIRYFHSGLEERGWFLTALRHFLRTVQTAIFRDLSLNSLRLSSISTLNSGVKNQNGGIMNLSDEESVCF